MNTQQIEELLTQTKRIADSLDLILESENGSIFGIEKALWEIARHLEPKNEDVYS
jgi:hypothetical protein